MSTETAARRAIAPRPEPRPHPTEDAARWYDERANDAEGLAERGARLDAVIRRILSWRR
jgi:hypothetical protein